MQCLIEFFYNIFFCGSVFGRYSLRYKRAADKDSGLRDAGYLPGCAGLHEDIADSGCLDGACCDNFACGVGGELVEQVILRAAADDVQAIRSDCLLHLRAVLLFRRTSGRGFRESSAPSGLCRDGFLTGFGKYSFIRRAYRRGRGNSCHQRRWSRNRILPLLPSSVNWSYERSDAFFLPVFFAFLQEPKPHYVFQQPDSAIDAAFVGEGIRECFIVYDGGCAIRRPSSSMFRWKDMPILCFHRPVRRRLRRRYRVRRRR